MTTSRLLAAAAAPVVLVAVALATLGGRSAGAPPPDPRPAVPEMTPAVARTVATAAARDAFLGDLDAVACRRTAPGRQRCLGREGGWVRFDIALSRGGPAASPVDRYVVDMENTAITPPQARRRHGRVPIARRLARLGVPLRIGRDADELAVAIGAPTDPARDAGELERRIAEQRVLRVPVRVRNTGRTRVADETVAMAQLSTRDGETIDARLDSDCAMEIALDPGERRELCVEFAVGPTVVPAAVAFTFGDETGVWRP